MAPKKEAAKTTAIANWDQELADLAKKATSIESHVGVSNFIKTAGGVMSYKNADIPGNVLNAVVVNHCMENALYEGAYNPDNPQPPICFAFGEDEDDMVPHENSSKPQHAGCKGCPNNEWGSADIGKGKACKNSRRLQLIAENDLEAVADAELAYVKLPVTSVKNWAGYVRQVSDTLSLPPLAVVTNISIVRDAKTQFKIVFKLKDKVAKEAIGDLLQLRKKGASELVTPYSKVEDAPPAAPVGKVGKRKF